MEAVNVEKSRKWLEGYHEAKSKWKIKMVKRLITKYRLSDDEVTYILG